MGNNERGVSFPDRDSDFRRRILNFAGTTPLTIHEAATHLGRTDEGVEASIASGAYLALPTEDGDVLPAWQFHTDGSVIIGVSELLRIARNDAWGIAGYLTKPQPNLEGEAPISLLRVINATVRDLYGE
jgi:hypothetical protein